MSDSELVSVAKTISDLRRQVEGDAEGETAKVARRLLSLFEERPSVTAESCIVSSRVVAEALREAAFAPVIVDGELELGPHSWLQHRIVVLELTDEWVVIDLAVRQVPAYASDELFWAVIPPRAAALTALLSEHYKWWTP